MKKTILMMLVLITGSIAAMAQGGGFQRRTVEERVKDVMDKMSPLKLDKDKTAMVDSIFTDFYKTQDKAMEEARSSGSFDRDAMQAKRREMMEARDAKLKKVLTEEEFKKFKDDIEPSMRPQRQGGGGGNRGNN